MERLQGRDSNNSQQSLVGPKIEYFSNLSKENIPYIIKVDSKIVAELLLSAGVPEKGVEEVTIIFEREPVRSGSKAKGNGRYEPSDKTITISADSLWRRYEEYSQQAERIASKKEKPKRQFKNLLYTKKLEAYLQRAPSERGMSFANKLIKQAIDRRLGVILMHESKHAGDFFRNKREMILLYQLFGLVAFLSVGVFLKFIPRSVEGWIYHNTNPFEYRAARFAKKNENDPKWRNLLTIAPKEKSEN